MEEKLSDFRKRPSIEEPSLKEVGYERLQKAKEQIKALEKKIYEKAENHIERQIKPSKDISQEEQEELKQRLYATYIDQRVKPLEEEVKVYEESLEDVLDKDKRVIRKLQRAEQEAAGITKFDLDRTSERILIDIRRGKDNKV